MTNDCEDVYGEFTSLYVLGDLDTAAEAAGRAMIGRPAEYSIERDEFAEACAGGLNELELVAHFGGRLNSVQQVRRLKQKWGVQGVAERARQAMPDLETLREWWLQRPLLTTSKVAQHAGVSVRALRFHFHRIGFSPHQLVAPTCGPPYRTTDRRNALG